MNEVSRNLRTKKFFTHSLTSLHFTTINFATVQGGSLPRRPKHGESWPSEGLGGHGYSGMAFSLFFLFFFSFSFKFWFFFSSLSLFLSFSLSPLLSLSLSLFLFLFLSLSLLFHFHFIFFFLLKKYVDYPSGILTKKRG